MSCPLGTLSVGVGVGLGGLLIVLRIVRPTTQITIYHMYLRTAGRTPDSPKTEEKIDPMLLPNRGLANLIATWLEEQRRAFRAVGAGEV